MENLISISYLIYIISFEFFVFGGIAYLVFWKDASPWWFLLAVLLSEAAYTPEQWAKLF